MNDTNLSVPVLGFAAYSGTGKTTLLKQIIPILKSRNIRLGIIKHAHHEFDIDHPRKDSYELRKAGADRMLIASRKRWALMVENEIDSDDPTLLELLNEIDANKVDLILVEGFKHEYFPKIELRRAELKKDPMFPTDTSIIAIATNEDISDDVRDKMPDVLNINDPEQIADYICEKFLKS